MKKINTYDHTGDPISIGTTAKGQPYLFDTEDFEKVRQHTWCLHSDGYVVTHIRKSDGKRTTLLMHRLVCPTDQPHIDHINHCKHDNQKKNLKPCSTRENASNRTYQGNCDSVGVYRSTRKYTTKSGEIQIYTYYLAQIWIDGKQLSKNFKTEALASAWYQSQLLLIN